MVREYLFFFFRTVTEILLSRVLKTDLERQYLLVLKENQILRRKLGKRPPQLTTLDRNFYVAVKRVSRSLLSKVVVIRPETVLAWHRKLASFVDGLDSARHGRPPVTDEIKKLVLEMKRANPHWGCKRIAGELAKLGFKTCRTSVARILREGGYDPSQPRKAGISWRAFMRSNGERMWACDFFSVSTVFLKKLQVFFIIDIHTKAIEMVEVVEEPTHEWLRNRLRSNFAFARELPGILISDRGTIYGRWLKDFVPQYGIELRQAPPHRPWFNCYAERMVRTFREELTDRILIYGEEDLRRVIKEYVEYYNSSRVHSGIEFRTPKNFFQHAELTNTTTAIARKKVVNGLITDFRRTA